MFITWTLASKKSFKWRPFGVLNWTIFQILDLEVLLFKVLEERETRSEH
jgi:hypothetical protein